MQLHAVLTISPANFNRLDHAEAFASTEVVLLAAFVVDEVFELEVGALLSLLPPKVVATVVTGKG